MQQWAFRWGRWWNKVDIHNDPSELSGHNDHSILTSFLLHFSHGTMPNFQSASCGPWTHNLYHKRHIMITISSMQRGPLNFRHPKKGNSFAASIYTISSRTAHTRLSVFLSRGPDAPCPACFRCFSAPTHLLQMSRDQAWWRADRLNRVCWSRDTYGGGGPHHAASPEAQNNNVRYGGNVRPH